ncbi:MAG: DUF3119 family protein [Jaaginema sp. PMC 1079.18]|nr:DUF3119 family protein [Jaaginema sp. PMC 1080.18]MEC4852115.1 DUF3119 family protein [Jaaginema sp. PMC 1079.18]MEC4866528.1 DUF3119 family protein [Jaaginema sp. PMC 1078.18]
MTTSPTTVTAETVTELKPSFTLPLFLIIGAIPLVLWQKWLGGAIALFGLFLLIQAFTIRLQFTETALDVYRSGKLIRNFPYSDWLNWRIFWQPVPILFYFREVKSIHFLPVLFDPKALAACLEPLPYKD